MVDALAPMCETLVEKLVRSHNGMRPTGAGMRPLIYSAGERELYDPAADPAELISRHDDPARQAVVSRLRSRMLELCEPSPPGCGCASGSAWRRVVATEPSFTYLLDDALQEAVISDDLALSPRVRRR